MRGPIIPVGRDQLACLGLANPMLARVHASVAIGLKDFFAETLVRLDGVNRVKAARYWRTSGGVNSMYCGFLPSAPGPGKLDMRVGGNYSTTELIMPDAGRWYLVHQWAQRSADCTWHVDGTHFDDVDITALVAVDIDGTAFGCGGRVIGTYERSDIAIMRLFILPDGTTFPTEAERNQIAAERADNLLKESPTLEAWEGYSTSRIIDADCVDNDQDGSTLENHGTAGDLTIGGGLDYREARTQVARSAIVRPEVDWFSLDGTHNAGATDDIGCEQGSYILEAIYSDIVFTPAIVAVLWEFSASATTEKLYLYRGSSGAWNFQARINSAYYNDNIMAVGDSEYGRYGLHVVHQVLDADAKLLYTLINNQVLVPAGTTLLADLDLSGDVLITYGLSNLQDNLLALRLWNKDELPSDWRDEIPRRVHNPWTVDEVQWDMDLRTNYECSATAQAADSAVLVNRAEEGTGDLDISGGDTFAESRVLAVRGYR